MLVQSGNFLVVFAN